LPAVACLNLVVVIPRKRRHRCWRSLVDQGAGTVRAWLIGSNPQLEDPAAVEVFLEGAFDRVRRRPPSGAFANMCSMTGPPPIRRSDALPADYPQFLAEIKARIAGARTRAVLAQAWPGWEVCLQAVSKLPGGGATRRRTSCRPLLHDG
jgi:hypothetical protein